MRVTLPVAVRDETARVEGIANPEGGYIAPFIELTVKLEIVPVLALRVEVVTPFAKKPVFAVT